MNDKPTNNTNVFISYSRKDKAFAQKIYQGIVDSGIDTWADWENIPLTSDWWQEIELGIESADAFTFVISPDSLASEVCNRELQTALDNNKRLIPILHREPEKGTEMNEALSAHNWVYMRDQEELTQNLPALLAIVNTDLGYVKGHTRLLERAHEWERNNRGKSNLITGDLLTRAEDWLAGSANKEPAPTPIQNEFIIASRRNANKTQRRWLFVTVGGFVISVVLAVFAFIARSQAETAEATAVAAQSTAIAERDIAATAQANAEIAQATAEAAEAVAASERDIAATAQAVAIEERNAALAGQIALQARALEATEPDLAMLLAAEAFRIDNIFESKSSLLTLLERQPYIEAILRGHTSYISALAVDPSGQMLASASCTEIASAYGLSDVFLQVDCAATGEIKLWDLATNQQIGDPLYGHEGTVAQLAFSPSGGLLASAGGRDIILWDTASREVVATLEGHLFDLKDITFSPDGLTLLSVDAANNAYLWDIATGTVRVTLQQFDQIDWFVNNNTPEVAYTPDGALLAIKNTSGQIDLWQASTGAFLTALPDMPEGVLVEQITFDNSNQFIAAIINGDVVHLWDLVTLEHTQLDPIFFNGGVIRAMRYNRDNNIVVLTSDIEFNNFTFINTYNPSGGYWTSQRQINENIYNVQTALFLGESGLLTASCINELSFEGSVCDGGLIKRWDLNQNGSRVQVSRSIAVNLAQGAVLPVPLLTVDASTGDLIALQTANGRARRFDSESGDTLETWSIPQSESFIVAQAISPNGVFAVATQDSTITIYDTFSAQVLSELTDTSEYISSMAFSNDGDWFAVAESLGRVLIYTTSDYQLAGELQIEAFDPILAFGPDGLLAIGSDGTLEIYLANTTQRVQQITWNFLRPEALAFPDGRTLAIVPGPAGGAIVLWDRITLREIATISPSEFIRNITYPADGSQLIAITDNDQILFFAIDFESWLPLVCQFANRSLTPEEWERYIPDLEYHQTCPEEPHD